MAITLLAKTYVQATSATNTAAIDTSGADFLVIVVANWQNVSTVTDNKANTWTQLENASTATNSNLRIHYVANPTVGTGHTFQCSVGSYHTLMVFAFSGVKTTSPFDAQNEGAGTGTSLATGSITPSENGELIIAGLSLDEAHSGTSIDESMTLEYDLAYVYGTAMGGKTAWKKQSAAAAINPRFSWTTSRGAYAVVASFKAAGYSGNSIYNLGQATGTKWLVKP